MLKNTVANINDLMQAALEYQRASDEPHQPSIDAIYALLEVINTRTELMAQRLSYIEKQLATAMRARDYDER